MTEYEVKITRQALDQMKEIIHYVSHNLMSPDVANHLLDQLQSNILKLSNFPKRHMLVEEEPWRTEGIRRFVVQNFLVYYWVDDEKSEVHVTAVVYNKRDQLEQLAHMDVP